MAPSQNTRSCGRQLVEPLPAPTRARAASLPGIPREPMKLPPKLHKLACTESNRHAKYSDLTHITPPVRQGHANDTDMCLLKGHPLSRISRFIFFEADANHPVDMAQENQQKLIIRINLSCRNRRRTRWNSAGLNCPKELDLKIHRVELAGWTSISFHTLVFLILDCGSYPHLQQLLATGEFHWPGSCSEHMKKLARVFCNHIFQFVADPTGVFNLHQVAEAV